MKTEKAIEILQGTVEKMGARLYLTGGEMNVSLAMSEAINALESKSEAEEYRTPKKVKKTKMTPLCFGCNVKLETGICPNCTFDKVIKDSQYCPYCGQALYWD